MLFHSFVFLFAFLPVTLLLYFGLRNARAALAALLAASIVFYAWWDWRFLPHLAASVAVNYAIGVRLAAARSRALLRCGVALNVALLAFFKFGGALRPGEILFPLGISFWTFTQIMFLCDAADRDTTELSFFRYALFVTFFPHAIAGPILHHHEMMEQFSRPEALRWTPRNFNAGLALLCAGLAKKVIIADLCAPWANALFDNAAGATAPAAWAGLLAYTFQIYFDFAGYSDMAMGLAWMFNIRFPLNFNAPYQAASPVEFWQRWHMTLGRFIREYLFPALDRGNRDRMGRRAASLALAMAIIGLWHGGQWTFLAWGAIHGVLLALNHWWRRSGMAIPCWTGRTLTFAAVAVSWVLFRALFVWPAGLPGALSQIPGGLRAAAVLPLLLGFVHIAKPAHRWLESKPLGVARAFGLAMLFLLVLMLIRDDFTANRASEFLYFQF
jgi:D-alanyl-lipoteichoic acid acyltransferase DltB (MBOAT superfamily)